MSKLEKGEMLKERERERGTFLSLFLTERERERERGREREKGRDKRERERGREGGREGGTKGERPDLKQKFSVKFGIRCFVFLSLPVSEERRVGPVVSGYLKVLSRIKEPTKVQCQGINAALTVAEYILMDRQSEATSELMKGQQNNFTVLGWGTSL